MTFRDRMLAVVVAVCWGINFPATDLALRQFPPILMVALRFGVIAIPTVLLVPRPRVPLRLLVGYGVGFGILQFAFLYLGMHAGMPAGMASLVLQASAPFTVLLGALLLAERLSTRQLAGVLVAVVGLAGIAVHQGRTAALLPVALTLAGGLGWAIGNVCSRRARPEHPMRFMLWMSVIPPLPMAALSLLIEGPAADGRALTTIATPTGWLALGSLGYIVLIATVFGSGMWTRLLARYPASVVGPFSMLVPVAGLISSAAILGEHPSWIELAFGVLVVGGVLLASLVRRRTARTCVADAGPAPDSIGATIPVGAATAERSAQQVGPSPL
jgi:O-acetylserine/cysteine efflux transporter